MQHTTAMDGGQPVGMQAQGLRALPRPRTLGGGFFLNENKALRTKADKRRFARWGWMGC